MPKRMCTMQLCFRGASPTGAANKGLQPRPALIFRGKGSRISIAELDTDNKRVGCVLAAMRVRRHRVFGNMGQQHLEAVR